MQLFNAICKGLLKHFLVEETSSKPVGAVARQSLLCLFIFAFPVTGSLSHPGQRINLSDPSISSCKSAVCYWGWFTTMPILVIISCNYECISQKRKANGKMWHISVYEFFYVHINIYGKIDGSENRKWCNTGFCHGFITWTTLQQEILANDSACPMGVQFCLLLAYFPWPPSAKRS